MIQRENNYQYQLDTSSRKEICPRCGCKTFVLYLDRAGNILSPDVGRCDREDKCKWHYPPKEYFRDMGLTSPAQRSSGAAQRPHSVPRYSAPSYCPPDYIRPKIFERTMTREQDNPLSAFLHSVFEPYLTREQITATLIRMGVGTAKQFGGSPVFWQMDMTGRLRTGKIMGYDAKSGKRVKKPFPLFQWVHKLINNDDFRLQQCYFGSHNLEDKNAIIGLFESEKAAVIMSLALSMTGEAARFIPLACGGADGFNPSPDKMNDPFDALRALRNRKVILFPDEGKSGLWAERGKVLRGFCREVDISFIMEDKMRALLRCDVSAGDAVDDIVISYLKMKSDIAGLIRMMCDEAEGNRIV